MTHEDFNTLNAIQQFEVIREIAMLLALRKDGMFKYRLYDLYGYYIEEE